MKNDQRNILEEGIYYAVKAGVVNETYAYKLKARGTIPAKHFSIIIEEAKKDGVIIDFSQLHSLVPNTLSNNQYPTEKLKNHAEGPREFLHTRQHHQEDTNGTHT